jgi:hypothetical protein
MIWNNPVYQKVPLASWMRLGNFPPGLTRRALESQEKLGTKELEALLQGRLIFIKRRKDGEDTAALAKMLRTLKNYTDQATFLQGFRVPQLVKKYHLPEDEDGHTEMDHINECDILVADGIDGLEAQEYKTLDIVFGPRALGNPKITILVISHSNIERFPFVTDAYEDRVTIL